MSWQTFLVRPPDGTKAPTGLDDEAAVSGSMVEPITSNSQREPFRKIVLAKCELGLSVQRIHQDLAADHGFDGKYCSVNRYVKMLGSHRELPFRRIHHRHS